MRKQVSKEHGLVLKHETEPAARHQAAALDPVPALLPPVSEAIAEIDKLGVAA